MSSADTWYMYSIVRNIISDDSDTLTTSQELITDSDTCLDT